MLTYLVSNQWYISKSVGYYIEEESFLMLTNQFISLPTVNYLIKAYSDRKASQKKVFVKMNNYHIY